MALPKKIKDRIAIIALNDAAGDLDDDTEDDMEESTKKTDKNMTSMCCPECGYEGPQNKFKN